MADKKDISYKRLLSKTLSYLGIVGLNPLAHTKASDIKAVVILTLEVLLTFSIAASFSINLSEPYAIIENFTGFAPAVQIVYRKIMLLMHRSDFRDIINYLDYFWSINAFGKHTANQVIRIQKMQSKFLKFYLWTVILSGIAYVAKPAFTDERELPVLSINICPIKTSSACYLGSYAFQSSCIAVLLCHIVLLDSLFLNLLLYGYCELEQIKYAFHEVKAEVHVHDEEPKVLQLTILIKHHIKVLEYFDKLNKLFSLMLLFQFSSSLCSLCTGLFMLTSNRSPPSSSFALKFVSYVISALIQIFAYCLAGQMILEQNESITASAYFNCKWWEAYQPKLRKGICLIIQRSQRPVNIVAGGLWKLEMDMFVKIVKGSFSLLTFM
uniref:Odorant receptor n=1 Tax=Protaetia brevitarsis TaxID=348688 RepID=A0A411HR96_PROBE|nr:odorant receptor [Protaetia brevitarsis]